MSSPLNAYSCQPLADGLTGSRDLETFDRVAVRAPIGNEHAIWPDLSRLDYT